MDSAKHRENIAVQLKYQDETIREENWYSYKYTHNKVTTTNDESKTKSKNRMWLRKT